MDLNNPNIPEVPFDHYFKIPYHIFYNTELNDVQKLLLTEILALSNNRNYCYANNHHFAVSLNKTKMTISKNISALEKKGFIQCQTKDSRRRIYVLRSKLKEFDLDVHKSPTGADLPALA